jgi:transposase
MGSRPETDGLVGDALRLRSTSGMPLMMPGRPAIGKPGAGRRVERQRFAVSTVLELTRSGGHLDAGDDLSPRRSPRAENPSASPPEFRAEAVRLVRTGGKLIRELAEDLGVSEQTLRSWIRQGDLDDGRRTGRLTSSEQEELRQLRRRVRVLEQDREILKKAAAFFAREGDQRR